MKGGSVILLTNIRKSIILNRRSDYYFLTMDGLWVYQKERNRDRSIRTFSLNGININSSFLLNTEYLTDCSRPNFFGLEILSGWDKSKIIGPDGNILEKRKSLEDLLSSYVYDPEFFKLEDLVENKRWVVSPNIDITTFYNNNRGIEVFDRSLKIINDLGIKKGMGLFNDYKIRDIQPTLFGILLRLDNTNILEDTDSIFLLVLNREIENLHFWDNRKFAFFEGVDTSNTLK